MTWSTRTALQCTGAVRTPIDAPMHQFTLVAPLSWSHRAGPTPRRARTTRGRHRLARRRPRSRSRASCSRCSWRCPPPWSAWRPLRRPTSVRPTGRRCRSSRRRGRTRCRRTRPNVRVAMTENDGLDVIVASVGGGVGAGRVRLARRAVPADRGDVDRRHRARVRRPVDPGAGQPDHPHGVGGQRRAPPAVRRRRQPDRARHADGALQLARRRRGPSTRCRSSSTSPTRCPGSRRRAGAALGGAGPQGMDWGFQELEAQAVAVRSYVLADLGRLRRLRRHL